MKTWFNLEIGVRFCWWDAPNQDELESIFQDHDVPWDRIVQVNLTTPSDWRWRDD
jgi:hypothetical protein